MPHSAQGRTGSVLGPNAPVFRLIGLLHRIQREAAAAFAVKGYHRTGIRDISAAIVSDLLRALAPQAQSVDLRGAMVSLFGIWNPPGIWFLVL